MVESTAILRFSGVSAQKMRQMADLVRGKDVTVALHSLQFQTKATAKPMFKLISSAVANAREKSNAAEERYEADAYFVKSVMVDEGPTQKRFRPRAQGRAYRIRKRSCHVQLVLGAHAGAALRRRTAPVKAAATTKPAKSAATTKPAKSEAAAGAKRGKKTKAAAAAK